MLMAINTRKHYLHSHSLIIALIKESFKLMEELKPNEIVDELTKDDVILRNAYNKDIPKSDFLALVKHNILKNTHCKQLQVQKMTQY